MASDGIGFFYFTWRHIPDSTFSISTFEYIHELFRMIIFLPEKNIASNENGRKGSQRVENRFLVKF